MASKNLLLSQKDVDAIELANTEMLSKVAKIEEQIKALEFQKLEAAAVFTTRLSQLLTPHGLNRVPKIWILHNNDSNGVRLAEPYLEYYDNTLELPPIFSINGGKEKRNGKNKNNKKRFSF